MNKEYVEYKDGCFANNQRNTGSGSEEHLGNT